MGFFDSFKGLGNALLSGFEAAAPSLINLGSQLLIKEFGPKPPSPVPFGFPTGGGFIPSGGFFPTPTVGAGQPRPLPLPFLPQFAQQPARPDLSGVPVMPFEGFQPAAFDIPGIDLRLPFSLEPGFAGQLAPGTCPNMFEPARTSIRARSLVRVTHPVTGNDVWYRNVGRPILWSGDLRACKRVSRIARRAARKR